MSAFCSWLSVNLTLKANNSFYYGENFNAAKHLGWASILLLAIITVRILSKSRLGQIEDYKSVSERNASKVQRRVLGLQIQLARGTKKQPKSFQPEQQESWLASTSKIKCTPPIVGSRVIYFERHLLEKTISGYIFRIRPGIIFQTWEMAQSTMSFLCKHS